MTFTKSTASRIAAAKALNDPESDAAELCERHGFADESALAAILMWVSEPLYGRTSDGDEPELMYRPWAVELAESISALQDAAANLLRREASTMPGIVDLAMLDRFGPAAGMQLSSVLRDLAAAKRETQIDPYAEGSVRAIVRALVRFLQSEQVTPSVEIVAELASEAMQGRWRANAAEIDAIARSVIAQEAH